MNRTRIKICGITRVEDAIAAAEAGADAIGVVFHEGSPRNVSESVGSQIIDSLPPFVMAVGVFVDAPVARISSLATDLKFHVAQLNGPYDVSDLAALAGTILDVIVAVKAQDATLEASVRAYPRSWVKALVLETPGTGVPGGSGLPNDWKLIQRHQAQGTFIDAPPIIAAGGLTPENVGDVVRSIRPWAVDVSSGVESSVGIKSIEKIRAFISAVRSADEDV